MTPNLHERIVRQISASRSTPLDYLARVLSGKNPDGTRYASAADADLVHVDGDEVIEGNKVFSGSITGPSVTRVRPAPIGAIGDSISANGWATSPAGVVAFQTSGQAYLARTVMLSQGRLHLRNTATNAQPGFTSQQVLDSTAINGGNQVQAAIDNGWDIVPVLLGTNDVPSNGGTALTALQANLDSIYGQLLNAGRLPVVCQIPPRNDIGTFGHTALNTWLTRYASRNGLPFAPYFDALVDPATAGTYLSGNAIVDGIHPSIVGGRLMGDVLWDAIKPHVGSRRVQLMTTNARPASDLAMLAGNPLFLLDTVGTKVPTGWILNTSTSTSAIVAADTGVPGQAWQITSTGTTSDYLTSTGAGMPAAIGDRIYCAFRVSATTAGGVVSFGTRDVSATVHQGVTLDSDITGGVFAAEWVHAGPSANLKGYAQVKGTGATLTVEQFTLLNLTRAGII